jgi:Protein of unknown function (DUF4089)
MTLSPDQISDYVKVSAELLEIRLDEAQIQRVAGHLMRTAAMAKALDAVYLDPDMEPSQVYSPAPFPVELPR